MQGDDGLGNAGFPVSQLHHQHTAEKIICDEVRAAPEEVTILTLGPLTNIARAFQRDPALPTLIDRLVIAGGSVNAIGDVAPPAEFNMFYDPLGARAVFRSAATMSLIPLDVTRQVVLTFDLLEQLPADSTRAGRFLRRILPFLFRAYCQEQGQESIYLHGAVALLAVAERQFFETREMHGDVEPLGELTTGMTVFDRRTKTEGRSNMEVATDLDANAAKESLVRLLVAAGQLS
jgi:purine nucleosidase